MKMKGKKVINSGGFCGVNSGRIANSYSLSEMSGSKGVGGFCFRNRGYIDTCFSKSKFKKSKLDTFYHENSGVIKDCFNDVDSKVRSAQNGSENTPDVNLCDFSRTTILNIKEDYGVNFGESWKSEKDNSNLLSLELKNNTWDITNSEREVSTEPVVIKTKEQLIEISNSIKNGDVEAASAYYILEDDINLNGKSWEPFGNVTCPFTGVFDGRGHKIYNFKVMNRHLTFAGFFGVIENAVVANLKVDGIVKAGKYTGAFVGMNKNSEIHSCSAIAQVIGRELVGGFVGNNTGVIEGCYFKGKIKRPFPLIWLAVGATGILLGLLGLYLLNPLKNTSIFNNVPVDPYAVKTKDNLYTGDKNKASFKFTDVVKFSDGTGKIDFGNPDTTNQSMTIKIQVTDQELLNKIGKTGRTSEEQEYLESSGKYDASNTRVTISESGLVLPGYELENMKLKQLPDGTDLPNGVYNGIAYLNFFNHETNEKAIINSQVPIAIVIE